MENSKSKNGKELTKTEQIVEPHRENLTERTRSKSPKTSVATELAIPL